MPPRITQITRFGRRHLNEKTRKIIESKLDL